MNNLNGYDIEDLAVGMTAIFAKTITEADIVLFAAASGDNNAVHINEQFAKTTSFGGRIAHGFLTASVISAAVANRLPGPGAVYISQQMSFKAPVRPGDTVEATVRGEGDHPRQEPCRSGNHLPGRRHRGHRGRGAGEDDIVGKARGGCCQPGEGGIDLL